MEDLKIVLMVSMFVILLLVIYDTAKSAFDFGDFFCLVISISVTVLTMISMNELISGSMKTMELPYAAMAIAIVAVILFAFISKHLINIKEWFSRRTDKKNMQETRKERLRR